MKHQASSRTLNRDGNSSSKVYSVGGLTALMMRFDLPYSTQEKIREVMAHVLDKNLGPMDAMYVAESVYNLDAVPLEFFREAATLINKERRIKVSDIKTEKVLRQLIRQTLINESVTKKKSVTDYIASIESSILSEAKPGLEFSRITAGELMDRIKRDIYILAAKEAGPGPFKAVVAELGEDVVELALDGLGAVPIVGNIASGIKALFKVGTMAKKGTDAIKNSKELKNAADELIAVAAGEYVQGPDSQANKNPLAKIMNVDDRMELPLKSEYLKGFTNYFINKLQSDPGYTFDSAKDAAEDALTDYMKSGKTKWEDAKGPSDAK